VCPYTLCPVCQCADCSHFNPQASLDYWKETVGGDANRLKRWFDKMGLLLGPHAVLQMGTGSGVHDRKAVGEGDEAHNIAATMQTAFAVVCAVALAGLLATAVAFGRGRVSSGRRLLSTVSRRALGPRGDMAAGLLAGEDARELQMETIDQQHPLASAYAPFAPNDQSE